LKKKEEKCVATRKWYVLLAVIGVITLVSYCNCLNNQFVFDDIPLILDYPTIGGIENIPRLLGIGKKRISYRPIRMISYAVDYTLNEKLWRDSGKYEGSNEGLNPLGYHISNLFYHIVTSFLVFLVVFRLTAHYRVSFLATALFALHPVHTDSVTYIAGRRDILFTLFYLAGFHFFLCYRKTQKAIFIIVSFLAYLLSLGSKEMAVTLPAIFLCYDLVENFTPLERKSHHYHFTYLKELTFALKRAILQSRYLYSLTFLGALVYSYYKVFIKSPSHQTSYYGDSMLTTFLTVGKILVHYMRLLVYPIRLNADYSYEAFSLSSSLIEPATFFSFIVLGVVGYAALRLLTSHKILAFGIIWFFITLLPVCHIFPHHELLAEHYLYLPSFGFCLTSSLLLNGFLKERRYVYHIYTSLIAVVLLFSFRIADRNNDWEDGLTLWEKTVETTPQCARAHCNLGLEYNKRGRIDEAISECNKALAINPYHVMAHVNLGASYVKKGRLDEAIAEYKRALVIKPRYADAHYNLGIAYAKKGRLDEAIAEYRRALALKPRYPEARNNLGVAYVKKGRLDEAIAEYKRALVLKPRYADAHYNLGVAYARKGRLDEAIAEYKKVLSIKPQSAKAHTNLGVAYHEKGELDKAIYQYKQAITLNPNYAGAHSNLAMAYFEEKLYLLAVRHCDKALERGFKVNPKLLKDLLPYR